MCETNKIVQLDKEFELKEIKGLSTNGTSFLKPI